MSVQERWVFQICDRAGAAISNITQIARDRVFQYRLGQPTTLTFSVPAEDEAIGGMHTDGQPVLDAGDRIVKAFRWERQNDGSMARTLKYLGIVWQAQDAGQGETAHVAVTCTEPTSLLAKRYAIAAEADGGGPQHVVFDGIDATIIVEMLIQRTNDISYMGFDWGEEGMEIGVDRSVTYQWRTIADVLTELSNALNGFDWYFAPSDADWYYYGDLVPVPKLGQTRSDIVFGWDMPPHNVARMERMLNMDNTANYLWTVGNTGSGADAIVSIAEDVDSQNTYGRMEVMDTFSDVSDAGYLAALTADDLNFRSIRREIVQFMPSSGSWPMFWDDFNIGDTVQVGAGPKLRGGFLGYMRIVGVDVMIDDIGREVITGVYTQRT